ESASAMFDRFWRSPDCPAESGPNSSWSRRFFLAMISTPPTQDARTPSQDQKQITHNEQKVEARQPRLCDERLFSARIVHRIHVVDLQWRFAVDLNFGLAQGLSIVVHARIH